VPGKSLPNYVAVDSLIQTMIEQVDSATLFDRVGELSGETAAVIGGEPYTITTRHTNSGEPIEKATQYAAEYLAALGLDVEYHDWAWSSLSGRNVIGELTGERHPEEIFVLCAHIDDLPSGPIAPGADDNASGVVAVLTAADILSQYRWGGTLRFALWTGEEQGLWGSHFYAQRSYSAGENIAGVLNLDMIAWNTLLSTPDIDLHATSSVTPTLQLAQLFSDVVGAYGLDLVPEIVANGTGSSDHASFWDYGYPAILGIEDYYPNKHDFNPYYHTADDQLQYLDMDYFADFVKASLATFAHMSDYLIYPYEIYLPLVVHQASAGPRR
jgi:Zn-dependent M28 family amino/carboxypeptidase